MNTTLYSNAARNGQYVWQSVLQDLSLTSISHDQVEAAIYRLSFPPSPPYLSNSIIVASILEHIWKAHWNLIFNNIPFITQTIITRIHSHLLQRTLEKDLLTLVQHNNEAPTSTLSSATDKWVINEVHITNHFIEYREASFEKASNGTLALSHEEL
ncbi:hypothetical protein INT45_000847 [Circinella minor]|uniref:Uncharacterized protein n=1 Tax=Circinella minor TaxID=1195481 RepID=A0A8H7S863_9FUNG|nr:hypothetical protein INT45_000847 [Circinella minor]